MQAIILPIAGAGSPAPAGPSSDEPGTTDTTFGAWVDGEPRPAEGSPGQAFGELLRQVNGQPQQAGESSPVPGHASRSGTDSAGDSSPSDLLLDPAIALALQPDNTSQPPPQLPESPAGQPLDERFLPTDALSHQDGEPLPSSAEPAPLDDGSSPLSEQTSHRSGNSWLESEQPLLQSVKPALQGDTPSLQDVKLTPQSSEPVPAGETTALPSGEPIRQGAPSRQGGEPLPPASEPSAATSGPTLPAGEGALFHGEQVQQDSLAPGQRLTPADPMPVAPNRGHGEIPLTPGPGQTAGAAATSPVNRLASDVNPASLTLASEPAKGEASDAVAPEQEPVTPARVDSLVSELAGKKTLDLEALARRSSLSASAPAAESPAANGLEESRAQDFARLLESSRSQMTEVRQAGAARLPPLPAAEPEQMAQGLRERLSMMVGQRLQQAEIRLDPPELGSLMIRLQLNQDQAQVAIVTQHAATRDLVEQSLGGLRQMLADQGVQLADAQVSQQSSQQQRRGEQGGAASGDSNLIDAEAETESPVDSEAAKSVTVGVDYYA